MALDLDGGRLGVDPHRDHFIALTLANSADTQPPNAGLGQPNAPIGSKDGVDDLDRLGSPDADHGNCAPALRGHETDEGEAGGSLIHGHWSVAGPIGRIRPIGRMSLVIGQRSVKTAQRVFTR